MSAAADPVAIKPRRVRFGWEDTPLHWVHDAQTTHTINVLHLLLPAGERWFVELYRQVLPGVDDERLRGRRQGVHRPGGHPLESAGTDAATVGAGAPPDAVTVDMLRWHTAEEVEPRSSFGELLRMLPRYLRPGYHPLQEGSTATAVAYLARSPAAHAAALGAGASRSREPSMTEYRIDELAQLAGTTVRNVRAYQERGLLTPPRRQGRAGVFDDAHLRRLRMIGQLLERGYTLANIGELLDGWEKGHAIDEVLGLGQAIPPRVTLAWLIEAFVGGPGSREATGDEPAALRTALELGVLEPDDDPGGEGEGFRVTNPRLLRAAVELARAGVPLAALAEHARGLRRDVERLARSFVDLVDDHLFAPLGDQMPAPAEAGRLSELVQRLRPLADDVVIGELDRAIEHLSRQRLHERLTQLLGPAATSPTATGREPL